MQKVCFAFSKLNSQHLPQQSLSDHQPPADTYLKYEALLPTFEFHPLFLIPILIVKRSLKNGTHLLLLIMTKVGQMGNYSVVQGKSGIFSCFVH